MAEQKNAATKGCIFSLLIVIVLGYIFYKYQESINNKPEPVTQVENITPNAEPIKATIEDPVKKLKMRLYILDTSLERAKSRTSQVDIFSETNLLKQSGEDLFEYGPKCNDKILVEKIKNSLTKIQEQDFPILRKNYAAVLNKKVWESDGIVRVFGEKNEIIEMISPAFVRNKEIKDVFESLQTVLVELRFKRVDFKWYRGQSDYTSFEVNALSDEILNQ